MKQYTEEQLKQLEETKIKYDAITQSVNTLSDAVARFVSTGSKSRTQVGEMSTAFNDLQAVIDQGTSAFTGTTHAIGSVMSKIPVMGKLLEGVADTLNVVGTATGTLLSGMKDGAQAWVQAWDAPSKGIRAFDKQMFDLNKRFGGTIDEASKFSDGMKMASLSGFARDLNLTTNEMAGFVEATKYGSLNQEQLSQTVKTGMGAIQLYGVATAFAEASNLDASTAANILNTVMNKQGKSAQEATNMLGMYAGVAKETGLAIDKVAETLNSAVANFAKIGMAADFGRPIMEGFSRTMKDMGLGIEESIGLTSTLTGALAGLTNNYGMAHVMFQRGGLDIGGGGGGGVLGSSIALQSAYLDAEKTGDQSKLADTLVRGMRDTLGSFTGGDIVTVQEANQDPGLANQFYIQQQMLKTSFGVSDDNSAARVLDMLSRLDEATRTGDKSTQDELKEQLQKVVHGRDQTLDEWEKANRNLERQTNLLAVMARPEFERMRDVARVSREGVDAATDAGGSKAISAVKGAGSALDKVLNKFGIDNKSAAYQIISSGSSGGSGSLGVASPSDVDVALRGSKGTGEVSHAAMRSAGTRANPNLAKGGPNMGDEVNRASYILAAQATVGEMESAGFTNREDLKVGIANALADALKDLKINVDLSERASGHLNVVGSLASSLTNLNSGGGSP